MSSINKIIDLTGQVVGKLTVEGIVEKTKLGKECSDRKWRCKCECGNTVNVKGSSLRSKRTRSCGCSKGEFISDIRSTHGHSRCGGAKQGTYRSWQGAKRRTTDPKHHNYNNYGGRGIKMCDEWTDKENGFFNFLRDMGERPPNTTLDRIDNNGDYTKENCRWATLSEQGSNSRNANPITYKGETLTRTQWAERVDINVSTLQNRLQNLGWTIERTLTTPVKKGPPLRVIHGPSGSVEYGALRGIIGRCYNPKINAYKDYGGRGIKVCDRWLDKKNGFSNFLTDMGKRPEGTSIDRINNDGDYCPENCRWATKEEQSNNTRRSKKIEYKGETLSITQWARRLNIRMGTLRRRIFEYDWSIERSLTTPVPGKSINTI